MLLGGWWDGDPPRHHAPCASAVQEGVTDLVWGARGAVCACVCLQQRECSAEGWGRGCWRLAALLGGCRGCRQQPVTVCVIRAGAAGG